MTKNILSSILFGLVSTLAVACGDAGAGSINEDLDPSEVLTGDQGGDQEADANLEDEKDDEAGNDDGQDEGQDEGQDDRDEDEDVGDEDEVPVVVVGPACGDGKLDASETCDDGNEDNGDGCSSSCETEVQGEITIGLLIDSLTTTAPPAEASCSGTIDLLVGVKAIAGSGRCFLDGTSNTLDYVLDVELAPSGKVRGEIEVILNGGSHILDVDGSLEDGTLYFEFEGVTLVNRTTRALWSGAQKAVLD